MELKYDLRKSGSVRIKRYASRRIFDGTQMILEALASFNDLKEVEIIQNRGKAMIMLEKVNSTYKMVLPPMWVIVLMTFTLIQLVLDPTVLQPELDHCDDQDDH
jgi:hypothetical protein